MKDPKDITTWKHTQIIQINLDYIQHLQNISILLISVAAIIFYKEIKNIKFGICPIIFTIVVGFLVFSITALSIHFKEYVWSIIVMVIVVVAFIRGLKYKKTKEIYKEGLSMVPLLAFISGVISLIVGLNFYGEMQTILNEYTPSTSPSLNRANPLIIWQICFQFVALNFIVIWAIWKVINKRSNKE